jgi:hypothetical protein
MRGFFVHLSVGAKNFQLSAPKRVSTRRMRGGAMPSFVLARNLFIGIAYGDMGAVRKLFKVMGIKRVASLFFSFIHYCPTKING